MNHSIVPNIVTTFIFSSCSDLLTVSALASDFTPTSDMLQPSDIQCSHGGVCLKSSGNASYSIVSNLVETDI